MVLTYQAPIFLPIIAMAPKMVKASGTDNFPHLILGSMMTSKKHELLTESVKINPPTF